MASNKRTRNSSLKLESALVVGHLSQMKAILQEETLDDDYCLDTIVTCTSNILKFIRVEASERKALFHCQFGIETLFKCIQVVDCRQVTENLLSLFVCLIDHKYGEKLAREGIIQMLLSRLPYVSQSSWCNDELLLQFHSLLLKLASKDKKFALKARLSGMLPITASLFKKWDSDNKQQLTLLLSVMKTVTVNSPVNAQVLGKHGCVSVLSKLLAGFGKKDFIVLQHCVEVLSALLKQSTNACKPAAQSCVKSLVGIHDYLHRVDKMCRHITLRKELLTALKVAVATGESMRAFHKADGLKVLYSTALEICDADSKDLRSVGSLTCTVLRKCLPPCPLPVCSHANPLHFNLPPQDSSNEQLRLQGSSHSSVLHDASNGQVCSASASSQQSQSTEEESCSSGDRVDGSNSNSVSVRDSFDSSTACTSQARVFSKDKIDLSQFESYFPELHNKAMPLGGIEKSLSAPAMVAMSNSVQRCTQSVENHLIEIPSATEELDKGALFNIPSEDDVILCHKEDGKSLNSCMEFSETPLPQVLGHKTLDVVECLQAKSPASERKLILQDVARVISPKSLVNRSVYDLDTVLHSKAQCETPAAESCSDSRSPLPDTTLRAHLLFSSTFESGNLRKAIHVREHEYDLILNSDVNCDHHHQWFFFKVSNMKPGVVYRFNVINCEKRNSQFNFGMQPLLYSLVEAQCGRVYWSRAGGNVFYHKNNFYAASGKSERKFFYTLSFNIVFPHASDICYLAYHYPYSYTMLLDDLGALEHKLNRSEIYYCNESLCDTLAGNRCPLITVTSTCESAANKEYIVLSSRVHPGEANASWIMKGVLEHLISDEPTAKALRRFFVFKIIPMMNPDGVINGNHRCSLAGHDLNRQWIGPDSTLHPTIHAAKGLICWLVANGRTPYVYCDFHGHSRKKNIFIYGCKDPGGSGVEKVLPALLAESAPFFSFKSCSFAVEKSKEATARVVVWKELGVARSYTLECTYCGTDKGPCKGRQIQTADLEEMGHHFCNGLLQLRGHSLDSTSNELTGATLDKAVAYTQSDESRSSEEEEEKEDS